MLLATLVKFEKGNPYWTANRDANFTFFRRTEQVVNNTIRARGYIYLNQIFELLGLKWNPEDANPCIKDDGVMRLYFVEFEIFEFPNYVLGVNILKHD